MTRNFYWSNNNSKMEKTAKAWKVRFHKDAKFVSFNIPQLKSVGGQKTCPYAGVCADICYADQGRMRMPAAMSARERNLEHINRITMKEVRNKIIEDVNLMRTVTHIRIHDSGDFFSRPYYKSWVEAAEECPDVTFYAYTKSIPFINWDSHPKNFRIVQSLGGTRDADVDVSRPHARIFATENDRKKAGYCDGNISDMPAILGNRKIGLVYHGNRNLTESNLISLRLP